MRNDGHMIRPVRLLPVVLLLLGTSASGQDMGPCAELENLLSTGLANESLPSHDYARAIIEKGDADQCTKVSLSFLLGRELLKSDSDSIKVEALLGAEIYGKDDELIGEIRDFTVSSNGEVDFIVIETGTFLDREKKVVIVDFDRLLALREPGNEKLRLYLHSVPEDAGYGLFARNVESVSSFDTFIQISNLSEVRASRRFEVLGNSSRNDFAGFGVVAFRRSPVGSLSERAKLLCHAFIIGIRPVSVLVDSGTMPDQQVVTAWPINSVGNASDMNKGALNPRNAGEVCNDAVAHYDWEQGDNAIEEAADFFFAHGKNEIAERIASPDQDGPWLLAWAPGAQKGSTEDDVLVLAFNLSHVSTESQAERVFQAWRVAIEQNPELWTVGKIANETWNSAIIRWANMIGRDLGFYSLLRDDTTAE